MSVWGSLPWSGRPAIPVVPSAPIPGTSTDIYDPRLGGSLVFIADVEAALNGGTLPAVGRPWGSSSWSKVPPVFAPAAGVSTIQVSDMGWRRKSSEAPGFAAYPPVLLSGPDIDRKVALSPFANDTFGWGSLLIAYPDVIPGVNLTGKDTAKRKVRIRAGMKTFERARGIMLDPASNKLLEVFNGLALTWQASEGGYLVPLRDPTVWLDAVIGSRKFLGTGGVEGPSDLTGTPWPLVRGGTVSVPVRACPVTLVDSTTRVYRWTDGNCQVVNLREDGVAVYTNAGQVSDCFAVGSPGAGAFYWDAGGQVKLGSSPVGTITIDGVGGGGINLPTVIRELLITTLGLPPGLLDAGSIISASSIAPYPGGWAWNGTETGRQALVPLLAGINARLVASRSGGLMLWPLRALTASAIPLASYDPDSAISVSPMQLDDPLMPPAASWQVGYDRTNSTTTTPKATVTPAERERLAKQYRTQAWSDAGNLLKYAQPSRPAMLETALGVQADALNIANAIGALWGKPRQLFQITLPIASVLLRDIGHVVKVTWPLDGLRSGVLGQVVGDSFRAGQSTASILVLV